MKDNVKTGERIAKLDMKDAYDDRPFEVNGGTPAEEDFWMQVRGMSNDYFDLAKIETDEDMRVQFVTASNVLAWRFVNQVSNPYTPLDI